MTKTWIHLFIFNLILAVNLIFVSYTIITDCDEVYNYWEPLYQLFAFSSPSLGQDKTAMFAYERTAFQPWEYASQYALRSYAYLLIPYTLIKSLNILRNFSALEVFYMVKFCIAFTTSLAQYHFLYSLFKFYQSHYIVKSISLLSILFSPAFYISSSSKHINWIIFPYLYILGILPNTVSMIFVFFALSFYLEEKINSFIYCIILNTWFGWPYSSLVLFLPLVHLFFKFIDKNRPITKFFFIIAKTLAHFLFLGVNSTYLLFLIFYLIRQ